MTQHSGSNGRTSVVYVNNQWEAQKDMALATSGAVLSMLILRSKQSQSSRAR